MQVIISLPNFPDWAIPMTKIVPVFKTLDVYNFDDMLLISDYYYDWEKVNSTDYELTVNIEGSATIGGNDIPLFVDLDLVIVNENNFYALQSEKQNGTV